MTAIPRRFFKSYPEAASLIGELGFLKVRAADGWWRTADGLLALAPVVPSQSSSEIYDPMRHQLYHFDAVARLQRAIAARKVRGSPRQRCLRLLELAAECPGETILTDCLDSVTWRQRAKDGVFSMTFRDHDFQATHDLIAPTFEEALAAAQKWPDKVSAREPLKEEDVVISKSPDHAPPGLRWSID